MIIILCPIDECHDIAEILLKLALDTNQSINKLMNSSLLYREPIYWYCDCKM